MEKNEYEGWKSAVLSSSNSIKSKGTETSYSILSCFFEHGHYMLYLLLTILYCLLSCYIDQVLSKRSNKPSLTFSRKLLNPKEKLLKFQQNPSCHSFKLLIIILLDSLLVFRENIHDRLLPSVIAMCHQEWLNSDMKYCVKLFVYIHFNNRKIFVQWLHSLPFDLVQELH